jgi:nucleotide-binding universal stress UspA family protein
MENTITLSRPLANRSNTATLKVHAPVQYADTAMRVLCATDLWARSDHAVQRTLALGRMLHAELLLLHVVDGQTPIRIAGRRADHAQTALRWRLRQHADLQRPPAVSVRVGQPHSLIARVALDWRADLIVLGGYRPRPWDRFLGTTAERLARQTRRPVLVVNREPKQAYSDAALIAASGASAETLMAAIAQLELVRSQGMRPRRLLYSRALSPMRIVRTKTREGDQREEAEVVTVRLSSFETTARTVLEESADLLVSALDPYPALSRLFGRNMSNVLLRAGSADVLVIPPAPGLPSRSLLQAGSVLRDSSG